jgi:hypothetical protein
MPLLRVRHLPFMGVQALKTIVYIDGFNLFYAIRQSGFKWLNLYALSQKVLPENYSVTDVKYYTAHVSGAADPDQPRRQQIYLNALKTVPQIKTFFGKFLANTVCRPLSILPVADRDIAFGERTFQLAEGDYRVMPRGVGKFNFEQTMRVGYYPANGRELSHRQNDINALRVYVDWMEEKGSDVNLASHLINDAWAARFEAAAVLSNDSDLVEPIRIVTTELRKPVILLSLVNRPTSGLERVSSSVRHIKNSDLRVSLFPDAIPGTKISKPSSWSSEQSL